MSAPDLEPITWQAIEALAVLVRGVRRANGYHTDLGAGLIVLDDDMVDDTSVDPAVFIDATFIDPGTSGRSFAHKEMDITLEFVVPRGNGENPKRLAHRGAADLLRVVSFKENDRSLPKCFRSLTAQGATLRGYTDEDQGASFVIAQVNARAGLTEITTPPA